MSKTPYVFHSLSTCASCGCTGDDFGSVNVEAFELTGELYCEDCADGAIEQWTEDHEEEDDCCPGCGACLGFTGAECDGVCEWAVADLERAHAALQLKASVLLEALKPFAQLARQIERDHGSNWAAPEQSVMRASLAYPVATDPVRWQAFLNARAAVETAEGRAP